MKKRNGIKIVIIVLVLLGELAVWAYPYSQKTHEGQIIGGADGKTSILVSDNKKDEKAEPTEKPKAIEEEKAEAVKKAEESVKAPAKMAIDNGMLILVNKNNYLDKGYQPNDLMPIDAFAKDRSPEGRFMRAEAAGQFNKMTAAAKAAGFEIVMTTAYRSYGFQTTLYNNYVANYGQTEADKFSAKPGYSEHQTGLAVDVSSPTVGYALTEEFDQTEEWKWLTENAEDFGFILRYPKGKTEITGYMYEAWHFRYVGSDVAKAIYKEDITLEEYMNK